MVSGNPPDAFGNTRTKQSGGEKRSHDNQLRANIGSGKSF